MLLYAYLVRDALFGSILDLKYSLLISLFSRLRIRPLHKPPAEVLILLLPHPLDRWIPYPHT